MDRFVRRIVLIADKDLELHRIVRHRARHRSSIFAEKLDLACGTVTLAELHIVSTVYKCATTVFKTFGAIRIRTCENRHVNFVRTDAHLDRNVQVKATGCIIIDCSVGTLFCRKRHPVYPDVGHISIFRNGSVARQVHGARGRVNLDVRAI